MKLSIIEEPELEFGGKNRHVDIRFGIRDYGSFETTEEVTRWIEKCTRGIPQKPSKQPNLFPAFPEVSSRSSFVAAL
jgi:hypothetical protein